MLSGTKKDLSYYVFSFFVVSISMWFLEILYSLVIRAKLVNPGFLFGPWCPIYGTGFLLCLLLVNKKNNRIYNLFKIFIILILVEYITSYIMGEILNNPIWDYSKYYFNINGRVCLHMSISFALIGYAIIYKLEPLIKKLYINIGMKAKVIVYILLIIFISDIFIRCFL